MAVAERRLSTPIETEAPPRPLRWTRAQYYEMAELGYFAGKRVELIQGEILIMPPMDVPHFRVVNSVGNVLKAAFGTEYFISNQCPLSLGLASDPEPDFAVIHGKVEDYTVDTGLPTTAALVVEASASTLAYDRTRKAALYAEAGIPEYWIINITERQLEVHRQPMLIAEGVFGYADIAMYTPETTVTPITRSTAQIAVADLLP